MLINEKWHINNITINNIIITIISVHLDAYLGPCKAFMMVFFFAKTPHHRCLTGSKIRLWHYFDLDMFCPIFNSLIDVLLCTASHNWTRSLSKPETRPKNINNPASIYLLKVNNRNTRKRFEICSKLTLKTPERGQWPTAFLKFSGGKDMWNWTIMG